MKDLILITGTNGFIGKNFFETFKNKLIIRKIISKNILKKKNYSKILEAIFIKYNPKIILHFAGYYTKNNSKKDNEISKKINFEYGKILLKLANKYEVKYFINVSTILEFYKSVFFKKYHYSLYKKKFTNYLFKNKKNLNVLQIYLNDTYGDNDTRYKLVPILIEKLKKKRVYLYNTNVLLNFISVNDLNKFIYIKILSKKFINEKVIIEAKDQYSLKELICSLKLKNKLFIYKNMKKHDYIIDDSIHTIPKIKLKSKLKNWLKKKLIKYT